MLTFVRFKMLSCFTAGVGGKSTKKKNYAKPHKIDAAPQYCSHTVRTLMYMSLEESLYSKIGEVSSGTASFCIYQILSPLSYYASSLPS
jgi:hypothetical protein